MPNKKLHADTYCYVRFCVCRCAPFSHKNARRSMCQRQNQSSALAKAKLEKLATAKANIITAIREGIPAAAVKDELLKIEAEREETEISLLKDTPRPIEIKANMAERYREKIINLCVNLNQEGTRQ
jgi:site-specific DNA recombinase